MSFTRARVPLHHEYQIGAEPIWRLSQVRHLRVHLTPELTFRDHTYHEHMQKGVQKSRLCVKADATLHQYHHVLYLVKLLRNVKHNPGVLRCLCLSVPDWYVWRRCRPPLLAVPTARTHLLAKPAFTRAIRTINEVHPKTDILA
ncbi:hypothetical protein O3G_MSEX000869 [Manduca sexta]|nr:hypothetical protein O3G_MSEX000869 [Manduca sexta]